MKTRYGYRWLQVRQRGVSLVVVLLLLAVLTMLASTATRMSIGEVWMAANEQFHRDAVDAASAGTEVIVARIGTAGGASAVAEGAQTQVIGSSSSVTTSVRATAHESVLVGSSAGRVTGEHFEIESIGTSARGARDVQVQGVMVVSVANGVAQFSRIDAGLSGGGAP